MTSTPMLGSGLILTLMLQITASLLFAGLSIYAAYRLIRWGLGIPSKPDHKRAIPPATPACDALRGKIFAVQGHTITPTLFLDIGFLLDVSREIDGLKDFARAQANPDYARRSAAKRRSRVAAKRNKR